MNSLSQAIGRPFFLFLAYYFFYTYANSQTEVCVGVNVAIYKVKSKITFDLSELVRQTDTVHTSCRLLIN